MDDVICSEKIRRRHKIKSQNIVHKLMNRQNFGVSHLSHLKYYLNVVPNFNVINIEKPACYLRKFSPCGKYLIAFSSDQSSVEVYQFKGCSSAADLIEGWNEEIVPNYNKDRCYEIRSKIFEKFFKLKHTINMDGSEKQLNRECSLFCNDGRHVIVGSASFVSDDSRPHFYELYTNNESITTTASSPIEDYTLYIIDIISGRITDSLEFRVDKIVLSHNQGLYLYNEILAILSIQHQTVRIYQIIDGTFQYLRSIGRFCSDEESYLLRRLEENNSTPSSLYRPFREVTINGLKHRILIFLFNQAKSAYDAGDKMALRRYYQSFDQYKDLRMWKIQLLDEDTLLLKYASEEVVTLKANEPNSHTSVTFVIYNIWEKKVLAVYNNTSEELLYLFENFSDCFRNPRNSFRSQWSCNNANNIHANLLHQRFKQTIVSAKGGGIIEARKRLLAQLPISAQSYSSSPYLDLSLFSFDDKFVSQMERPKQASEFPIRFFARDSGLLRFKIHTGFQKSAINSRRLVAFLFHPHEPFAISIQRINSNYIANLHVWSSNVNANT